MIWIGTSGWQYRDWRGSFYPQDLPQRSWLAHYATRFPTVELNNSFYRLPEADRFRRWRDTTPDGFLMTVKASRVLFIAPSGKILKQYGTRRVCRHDPPKYLALPNGDTPMPDGRTLVTEITGSWIDAIGADGQLEWTVRAPVAYPSDAQWLGNGKILLADYSYTGHVLWEYGPSSGPGRLSFPSLALMLPSGLVAVNDDFRNRVIVIDPKTNRIVWQYGQTDVAVQTPVLRRYLVRILGGG